MRLQPKLTLGILAAAAVPLAISGLSQARLSARALRSRIMQDHAALAHNAADGVASFFDQAASTLELLPELSDLERADPELAAGVLRVAYHAEHDAAVIAFLDDHGAERVPSVYLSGKDAAAALGKPAVRDADRDAFLRRVPVAQALAHGRALGPIAWTGDPAEARVALAVAVKGADGTYLLAADLSLARLSARLSALSQAGVEVSLVDGARRAIAPGLPPVALPADRDPTGALPAADVASVRPPGRAAALAAFAPAATWGVGVLVAQPEAAAFSHVAELRRRALYWLAIAALCAAVVGIALARDVARRIATLAGSDELAGLARSFNKMAADLGTATDAIRKRNAEIEGKNAEISKWNRELEQRVADKTRELRQAEDALLRARSLAAVGNLGAGMAHEINNPLTGILGIAQLLLADLPAGAPERALVGDLENQAQRIRAIVKNLLELSDTERGAGEQAVDLNAVVTDALALSRPELERGKIEIVTQLAGKLPAVRGDAARLEEVVIELCENARRAMPKGGTLTIATSTPDDKLVALRVTDTGGGIAREHLEKIFDPFFTTKMHWRATGMGLTMVHKVVEQHRGSIAVDSPPGRGASFTLSFPAAAGTHLV
jgi:signal transduction histidine kinase